MHRRLVAALSVLCLLSFTAAASSVSCNATSSCPEELPCCSQYGVCGTGAYCLGGCDPRHSFNLTACMPMPVCRNVSSVFDTTDILEPYTSFLGNSSESDWVYTGHVMDYDDAMIMAMPNQSAGTVISSTFYVWYGKIRVRMRSSHRQGVVSAFILFSNVQDEIDNEFIGADLFKAQTNFYYQGVLNYTNSRNITTNNTFEEWHTYEIDWSEDRINWSVDGEIGRTLRKSDTWNSTNRAYYYPQTPSRVQLSLWPGGDQGNAIGTINWAGGEIDWNAPDLTSPGYYYAMLESVDIECYDPPSDIKVTGSNAYKFNSSEDFDFNGIEISNDRTYLGSFEASGLDPTLGDDGDSTATAEASVPTGQGTGTDSSRGSNSSDSDSGASSRSSSSSSSSRTRSSARSTSSSYTGWIQNTERTASSTAGAAGLISLSGSFMEIFGISVVTLIGTLLL